MPLDPTTNDRSRAAEGQFGMDGSRFDHLARSLAGTSRRGLIGGLLGIGAGLAGFGAAEAQSCPPGQVARRGQCVCRTTGRPPVGGACPGFCGPALNYCAPDGDEHIGVCGRGPDCICSQTSAGLVCHHLDCAVCASCTSDADCAATGRPNAICIASDDCCLGGSSCLTPCERACNFSPLLTGASAYGA
jgi:hypothetical protein